MKYLAFAQYNWEDAERVSQSDKKIRDERAKDSDVFPEAEQLLFEPHTLTGELPMKSKEQQAIWIFETDNEEHLLNYEMTHAPYLDIKFIPITESRKIIQQWMG